MVIEDAIDGTIYKVLKWFKPGTTVEDLLKLDRNGDIDLGLMIENERADE